MTGAQREYLRHAVSQARLARVKAGNQVCERCGGHMEPARPCNVAKKRFCSDLSRNEARDSKP